MKSAPIPANEEKRLAALYEYGILDTLHEQAYEDIIFLAAQICGVPMATMSLIDRDRQWFKAKVGMNANETSREIAFCAHAILRPEDLMIVKDATKDERFSDNPMVTENPHIRFYAGAPLVTSEGDALGTLCVIDQKPRELSMEQLAALTALSRQVMAQLELRKALDSLTRHVEERAEYERRLEAYQLKLESMNEALSQESRTDRLTGLNNRGSFDEFLFEEFERALRRNRPLSLLMMDIDHFKKLNDTFGHAHGDEVLRQVSKILGDNVRPADFAARYGGEEFVVVLPNTSEEGAMILAERIRKAIQNNRWDQRAVTVSIGVATQSRDHGNAHDLTCSADSALYESKQNGRNRATFASQ